MSPPRRPDVVLVILLSVAAAVATFHGARQIDPLVQTWEGMDVWLSGDTGRVFLNMTSRDSDHYRVKVHPLFSLATYPLVKTLRVVGGVAPATAVHAVMSVTAAVAIGLFFGLLRLIGCRRLDAALFSLLAAVSASAMFWFVVPETYALGCASILAALVLAALSERQRVSAGWYTAVSALTLSFTVTNWVARLLATWSNFRWRRALRISVAAFALVTALWGVQKAIFPTAVFFLGDREEAEYVLQGESGGPARRLRAFFFHSIVMPAPGEIYRPSFYGDDGRRMSVQASSLGSGGPRRRARDRRLGAAARSRALGVRHCMPLACPPRRRRHPARSARSPPGLRGRDVSLLRPLRSPARRTCGLQRAHAMALAGSRPRPRHRAARWCEQHRAVQAGRGVRPKPGDRALRAAGGQGAAPRRPMAAGAEPRDPGPSWERRRRQGLPPAGSELQPVRAELRDLHLDHGRERRPVDHERHDASRTRARAPQPAGQRGDTRNPHRDRRVSCALVHGGGASLESPPPPLPNGGHGSVARRAKRRPRWRSRAVARVGSGSTAHQRPLDPHRRARARRRAPRHGGRAGLEDLARCIDARAQ